MKRCNCHSADGMAVRVLVHEACRDAAVLFTVMAYLFAPPKVAELGGLRQLLEGKRDPARTPRD